VPQFEFGFRTSLYRHFSISPFAKQTTIVHESLNAVSDYIQSGFTSAPYGFGCETASG
jgi:hypothetical protein